MLDVVVEAGQSLAEVDLGAVMPSGGPVASGKRASKIGTGGPGLGFGPGDGGVPARTALEHRLQAGQTAEEYARQLDALGVEMAVVVPPDQLMYVSNFSERDADQAARRRAGRPPALLPLAGPRPKGVRHRAASRRPASRSATKPSFSSIRRGRAAAGRAGGPVQGATARRDSRHAIQRRSQATATISRSSQETLMIVSGLSVRQRTHSLR